MSETPTELKYTSTHEWLRENSDGTVTVGISDHAQELLGDVVFAELPEAGQQIGQGEQLAMLESVKAASDVYAPVSGEVVEVNSALEDAPELVNEACYTEGWLVTLRASDPEEFGQLLDADAYLSSTAED
ncbi:glycine cleavage system protein GcvH [Parahaliea maris]|uniref:Glycine cleavage system H protein n=1 Tax=Parahaliea maris TaxID=2716870 RepID=A0A5C8ZWV3_9GAMM|nr:glycine cleavage system protein GcvH [Parahaliea maris]TXS92050.1 glycine cleavage system protein GcvH [Parahaliea maris]